MKKAMDWFGLWFGDKESMVTTMLRNMQSDLDAGYDPNGHCIRKQKVMIEDYVSEFNRQLDMFKTMDDKEVSRWCYYDLKKRGAI